MYVNASESDYLKQDGRERQGSRKKPPEQGGSSQDQHLI